MGLPLDKAALIALFVECILYGISVITFILCMYILGWRGNARHGRLNMPMVFTAVLLFICSTIHVSIDLSRVLCAFQAYQYATVGPVAYLRNVANLMHMMKSAIYITETIISDALVVYRCHVVVKRYSVTVLLSIMVIGCATAGYGSIYVLVHSPASHASIFEPSVAPWITSFNVITAATNILATSLIAYSIWKVKRALPRSSSSPILGPAILIIVESGAVYAFALLLLTGLYTTDSNAQYIVLDGVSPLIGIVFGGMIIRIGLYPVPSETQRTSWVWTTEGVLTEVVEVGTAATRTYPGNNTYAAEMSSDVEIRGKKDAKEVVSVFLDSTSQFCSK